MHQGGQGHQGGLSTARPLEERSALELVRALQKHDQQALRAVRSASRALAAAAERLASKLRAGGRLIYLGAGTSGRLGMLDAVELAPTFGLPRRQARALVAGGRAALTRAVEGAEDDGAAAVKALRRLKISSRDWVAGISASGTTPFVLAGLREARARGAETLLLCCRPPPRPAPAAQVISLRTGPELIPGSTRLKAGTATKLALNALSTAALVRLGHVYRGEMVDLLPTNRKLRDRAEALVQALAGVSAARARALLRQAGGAPRLALAIHFTGLSPAAARRALRRRGLGALEREGG